MFCFCFCFLQLTWYRSILFILAHVSQALDIVTDFPFCFCSVIQWMIYIFHACRGWSDMMEVREICSHWKLGSLASWENAAVCCQGSLICAGKLPQCLIGQGTLVPRCGGGHQLQPVYLQSCARESVSMKPLHF